MVSNSKQYSKYRHCQNQFSEKSCVYLFKKTCSMTPGAEFCGIKIKCSCKYCNCTDRDNDKSDPYCQPILFFPKITQTGCLCCYDILWCHSFCLSLTTHNDLLLQTTWDHYIRSPTFLLWNICFIFSIGIFTDIFP